MKGLVRVMTLSGVRGLYSSFMGYGTGMFEGFKYQTKEFCFTLQTLDVSWWILVVNGKTIFHVSGKLVWCSVQNTMEWGRRAKEIIKELSFLLSVIIILSCSSNLGQWQWNWKEKGVKMLGKRTLFGFLFSMKKWESDIFTDGKSPE